MGGGGAEADGQDRWRRVEGWVPESGCNKVVWEVQEVEGSGTADGDERLTVQRCTLGGSDMPRAQEFDVTGIEERAAAEFPEVAEALRVFEISYDQYVAAIQAESPARLYSASSTCEE